jgi:hypothetical protein
MDSPISGGAPSSRASCGRWPDRSGSATLLHRAALLRPGMEGGWCGRDVLLHLAAWLPLGHVDGERLETVVPRAGAESVQGVLHPPLVGEALRWGGAARAWIPSSSHNDPMCSTTSPR